MPSIWVKKPIPEGDPTTVPATVPEILVNARAANERLDRITAELAAERVQPVAPNGNQPQNTTDGKVGVAGRGSNPGKVTVAPTEPSHEILAGYLASIDLKALITSLIEKEATIGNVLAGFKTIVEQATVTNTLALAEHDEKLHYLETELAALKALVNIVPPPVAPVVTNTAPVAELDPAPVTETASEKPARKPKS